MQYVVKYKLFFHNFNMEVYGPVLIENGLAFFYGEQNSNVYNEIA